MSQDALIILLFKVVLVADVVVISAFVVQYSLLAAWYHDPIGRTIVVKDLLLLLVLIPSVLSLFFHFSRLTSNIAAWVDVAAFGLITPVMIWRMAVFQRIHRQKPRSGTGEG